jgi:predicted DNA-binding transcriptional regulator
MPYKNIKNFDLPALEKLSLILNKIRYQVEVRDTLNLDMGRQGGEQGISEEDFLILENLYEHGILNFLSVVQQTGFILSSVSSKKKLYNFSGKINKRIKELRGETQDYSNRLEFDEPKSLLIIREYKIFIARRKEKTDEHAVLFELFKNKNEGCFYSELSQDILDISPGEYKGEQRYWQKFYGACERIQKKIAKATKNDITDFLIFNSGIKGSVQINKKYIVSTSS